MLEVRLRPKGQVTIPAVILESAQISTDATFEVALVNGVITLTPKLKAAEQEDIMAFAGLFKGAWGNTPEAVSQAMDEHRGEWER